VGVLPSRHDSIGAIVLGLVSPSMLWIYLTGELLGGAAAALTFKALNPNDR